MPVTGPPGIACAWAAEKCCAAVQNRQYQRPLMLEHLRHLELPEAAEEHRRLQRPGHQVRRRRKADRAAGVGLLDAGASRGEIHQPARPLGIAHHPWVAHRAVVPEAGAELLVVVAAMSRQSPSPTRFQSMEIVAGGVADPLDQAVLGMAGPGIEEMPAPSGPLTTDPVQVV